MSARPDAGGRVTLGVVFHRSGHMTLLLHQVGGQLDDPVDGADKHLARPLVDRQVGEGSVGGLVVRPAGLRERRGGKSRHQEEEGEKRKERKRRGKRGGGHGEERRRDGGVKS